jgi:hypothetical protein
LTSLNPQNIREAFVDWLNDYDWDWYVTLTFRNDIGEYYARENFQRFHKEIRHRNGYRPEFVRVTEYQQRGVPHYHSLMLNVGGLRRMDMVDWCYNQFGISRIFPYDRDRGASYYLGKYILKGNGDIQLSRGLRKYSKSYQLSLLSDTDRKLVNMFDCEVIRGSRRNVPKGYF